MKWKAIDPVDSGTGGQQRNSNCKPYKCARNCTPIPGLTQNFERFCCGMQTEPEIVRRTLEETIIPIKEIPMETKQWYKDKVFYQVWPRSF